MTRARHQVLVVASAALPVAALLMTARLSGGHVATPAAVLPAVPVAAPVAAVAPRAPSPSRRPAVSRSGTRLPQVDPAWATATAARNQIPAPAVTAYGRAVLEVGDTDPWCHLGWTTLAGIGAVESGHGTVGGRTLEADGHSSSPVIGPALDGRGYAAVPATADSVRWHGDVRWDHAVGPLQFIPSTWRRWAADGDGDGVADPNDLDDAALAAGRYLCADGHDLATGAGWYAAVRSYNHSDEYVAAVRAVALGLAG